MGKQQTAIIVLGMHRSGTSVLTGTLEKLGVALGSSLMPPNEGNPKGYFENLKLFKVNESILKSLGSSWDDEYYTEKQLTESPDFQSFVLQVKKAIYDDFKRESLFAIKDPRINVLFPVYEKALQELGIAIKVIFALRNPAEIMNSIQVRNSFSHEKTSIITLINLFYGELYSRSYPRVFAEYGNLIQDPFSVINTVNQELSLNKNTESIRSQLAEFVDPDLKHYQILSTDNLFPQLAELYQLLLKGGKNHKKIDELRSEFLNMKTLFLNQELRKKIQKLTELEKKPAPAAVKKYAGLFVDTGFGFDARFRIPMELQSDDAELEFDLNGYETIQGIRLDPLREPCILHIKEAEAEYEDGQIRKIEAYKGNYFEESGGKLFFGTVDPQLIPVLSEDNGRIRRFRIRYFIVQSGTPAVNLLFNRYKTLLDAGEKRENSLTNQLENAKKQHENQLGELRKKEGELKTRYENQVGELRKKEGELKTQLAEKMQKIAALSVQIMDYNRMDRRQAALNEIHRQIHTLFSRKSKLKKIIKQTARLRNPLSYVFELREYQQALQITEYGLFDRDWYLEQNPDVAESGVIPAIHYLTSGWKEGRNPYPLFDSQWYLDQNPDVAQAGINPLHHFLEGGWKEGRNPCPLFDCKYYIEKNQDVGEAGLSPLIHFLESGWKEGRNPFPLFDCKYYLEKNPDVAEAGLNPLIHFLERGWKEGRNPVPLFDCKYYLDQNPDVAQAGINPLIHFLESGWKEGRNPFPLFDCKYYLDQNPDVTQAGINPLIHFLESGWKEGRNPHPMFDCKYYQDQNPDVAQAGINPLIHFLESGSKEGRNPHANFDLNQLVQKYPFLKNKAYSALPLKIREGAENEKLNQKKPVSFDIDKVYEVIKDKKTQSLSRAAIIINLENTVSPGILDNLLREIDYSCDLFTVNNAHGTADLINSHNQKIIDLNINNLGNEVRISILDCLHKAGYIAVLIIDDANIIKGSKDDRFWFESMIRINLQNQRSFAEMLNLFESNKRLGAVGPALDYVYYPVIEYSLQCNEVSADASINGNTLENTAIFQTGLFWLRPEIVNIIKADPDLYSSIRKSDPQCLPVVLFQAMKTKGMQIHSVDTVYSESEISFLSESDPVIFKDNDKTERLIALRLKEKYYKYYHLRSADVLDIYYYWGRYSSLIGKNENFLIYYLENESSANQDLFLSEGHSNGSVKIYSEGNELIIVNEDGKSIFKLDTMSTAKLIKKGISQEYLNDTDKNHSNVKISVICPTYNHIKFIDQAFESIINQETGYSYEILIGDDCSADGTSEKVKEFAEKYPEKVKAFIRDKNIGGAANYAELLANATGQYLAFNEMDDYWVDPFKLQKQIDYMEAHPECSVSFHPVYIENEDDGSVRRIFPENPAGRIFNTDSIVKENYIQTNSVIFRGNLFKTHKMNELILPRDWYRIILYSLFGEIHLIPEVMAVYRIHSTSLWSSRALQDKKFGIPQLVFSAEANKITKNMYQSLFVNRINENYTYLYWKYFENINISELFKLLLLDRKLSKTWLKINEINIDIDKIQNEEDMIEQFRNIYAVDVIVTAYNHGKYLNQTIDSIISQKGLFKLKIIIADDYSSDNSDAIIKDYIARRPDLIIKLESTENIGLLKNMQKAFSFAEGDFTAICEGDDYWTSDLKLQKQMTMLLKNKDYSMCFNWIMLDYFENSRMLPHPQQANIPKESITFEDLVNEPLTANFSCCFYRKETIKKVPESYYENQGSIDWLFNLYAANTGKIGFIREIMSVYRVHSNGQWSGLSEAEKNSRREKVMFKLLDIFPERADIIKKEINHRGLINYDQNNEYSDQHQKISILINIDEINIQYQNLFITGWILNQYEDSYKNGKKWIELSQDPGFEPEKFPLLNNPRDDVHSLFSGKYSKNFIWSGFTGIIPLKNIKQKSETLRISVNGDYLEATDIKWIIRKTINEKYVLEEF